jgi:hypothetical protein
VTRAENDEDAPAAPSAPGDAPPRPPSFLDRLVASWPRLDALLFPLFAGACVLYAAVAFYGSMHRQTQGVWSAPLDDVFIHFDYARATARGYPFQWSEGNGFSSGNTSLTYPFVLALGYRLGFHGMQLMKWAAIVACLSTLGFLMGAARLFEPLGRWAKYLLPPAVLSLGALDWSLFSGMENALHLGLWGLALVATLAVAEAPAAGRPRPRGWAAGLCGALLFATRPESVVCVAAFGGFAAIAVGRREGVRRALATLLRIGIPGALVLAAQLAADRVFTGEWTQSGAISKLAFYNPYMTAAAKWDEYRFLLHYVVDRLTEHHFAGEGNAWGWLVPAVALLPLLDRRTRPFALLLWAQIVGWLALVAMNGQVRWQNERYTMSAVAWLFALAALGLGVLMSRASPFPAAAGAAVATFWHFQAPNMADQLWFFGRACRNIRDQHLTAGVLLQELDVHRVLVGDAGALLYAADRPGLDLIGLGGYHDLPFARAAVHGLGASLELIERMPPGDRPDTMAIYPSWWGDLPTLFGHRLTEVPVAGNVICGGSEKVLYRADWSALDASGRPRSARRGEEVVDSVDVADLVSEKEHGYVFPHPEMGYVEMRVLPDPDDPLRDLFDAGRSIPEGASEAARVRAPRGPGRLVVRTATTHAAEVEVRAGGQLVGRLHVPATTGWVEPSIDLPAGLPETFDLVLTAAKGEWADYHVWVLEARAPRPAASAPRE